MAEKKTKIPEEVTEEREEKNGGETSQGARFFDEILERLIKGRERKSIKLKDNAYRFRHKKKIRSKENELTESKELLDLIEGIGAEKARAEFAELYSFVESRRHTINPEEIVKNMRAERPDLLMLAKLYHQLLGLVGGWGWVFVYHLKKDDISRNEPEEEILIAESGFSPEDIEGVIEKFEKELESLQTKLREGHENGADMVYCIARRDQLDRAIKRYKKKPETIIKVLERFYQYIQENRALKVSELVTKMKKEEHRLLLYLSKYHEALKLKDWSAPFVGSICEAATELKEDRGHDPGKKPHY